MTIPTGLTVVLTNHCWGGDCGMGGGMWGGALWWPLLWLVLVALLVLGAIYLLRGTASTSESDPAMEELRKRYARGEISDEEFEERAARLRGGPGSTGDGS